MLENCFTAYFVAQVLSKFELTHKGDNLCIFGLDSADCAFYVLVHCSLNVAWLLGM